MSWYFCNCSVLTFLTQWQYTNTISLTVPSGPAFLGMPLKAQGLDFAASNGSFCIPSRGDSFEEALRVGQLRSKT